MYPLHVWAFRSASSLIDALCELEQTVEGNERIAVVEMRDEAIKLQRSLVRVICDSDGKPTTRAEFAELGFTFPPNGREES